MARYPGWVGGSYKDEAVSVDAQTCVNLYPAVAPSEFSKNRGVLRRTPGLRARYDLGTGPVPALFHMDGRAFAIAGEGFFELKADNTYTLHGPVKVNAYRPTISSNGVGGSQLFIVSGGYGYIFDLGTNVLTEIAAGDFPQGNARRGAFVEGVFVVQHIDAPQFSYSAAEDGTTWDALDTAQKSRTADNVLQLLENKAEIWLFGSETTEVWTLTGDADDLFEPMDGVKIEEGIAAPETAVKLGDAGIFWLAQNGNGGIKALRAQAYSPARISPPSIEATWGRYTTIADAVAYGYEENGHTFYVVTFPNAGRTWVYDITTGEWHERAYWNTRRGFEAHLGISHCYAFGRHLVGCRRSGTIYQLSSQFFDDAGDRIRRMRRAPHLTDEHRTIFYNTFELAVETGVGIPGVVCSPQIKLRSSFDGGRTWVNWGTRSIGAIGAYDVRTKWDQLGSGRNCIFEISMDEAVDWTIADAYLDFTVGTH